MPAFARVWLVNTVGSRSASQREGSDGVVSDQGEVVRVGRGTGSASATGSSSRASGPGSAPGPAPDGGREEGRREVTDEQTQHDVIEEPEVIEDDTDEADTEPLYDEEPDEGEPEGPVVEDEGSVG